MFCYLHIYFRKWVLAFNQLLDVWRSLPILSFHVKTHINQGHSWTSANTSTAMHEHSLFLPIEHLVQKFWPFEQISRIDIFLTQIIDGISDVCNTLFLIDLPQFLFVDIFVSQVFIGLQAEYTIDLLLFNGINVSFGTWMRPNDQVVGWNFIEKESDIKSSIRFFYLSIYDKDFRGGLLVFLVCFS